MPVAGDVMSSDLSPSLNPEKKCLGYTTLLVLTLRRTVNSKITSFTNTIMLQSSPLWVSGDIFVNQAAVEQINQNNG